MKLSVFNNIIHGSSLTKRKKKSSSSSRHLEDMGSEVQEGKDMSGEDRAIKVGTQKQNLFHFHSIYYHVYVCESVHM